MSRVVFTPCFFPLPLLSTPPSSVLQGDVKRNCVCLQNRRRQVENCTRHVARRLASGLHPPSSLSSRAFARAFLKITETRFLLSVVARRWPLTVYVTSLLLPAILTVAAVCCPHPAFPQRRTPLTPRCFFASAPILHSHMMRWAHHSSVRSLPLSSPPILQRTIPPSRLSSPALPPSPFRNLETVDGASQPAALTRAFDKCISINKPGDRNGRDPVRNSERGRKKFRERESEERAVERATLRRSSSIARSSTPASSPSARATSPTR